MSEMYSTNDVAVILGVTLRTLQWLDERGIVRPKHVGHRRIWSEQQASEAMLVTELRRKGLSLQKAKRILHRVCGDLPKAAGMMLVTDGRISFLEDDQARVIDILVNAKTAMVLVEIRPFLAGGKRVH